MIKFLKKFASLVPLIVVTTLLLQIPQVKAQTGGFSGTGQEVICRNGSRDYSTFLSSVISSDGFEEYWKDILVRYNANLCLYNDIDNLLKRINKAREQVRLAFYSCDIKADTLKKNYYTLEAELYFLRKYTDVKNDQIIFTNPQIVKDEMQDYFVLNKGFFTADEVGKLYQQFQAKYKAREQTYTQCEDPTWGNLIAKWNELNATIKGSAKEFTTTVEKHYDTMAKVPMFWEGGFSNFLSKHLDARINGIEPKMALQDILTELDKNLPSSGFTFQQLNDAKSAEDKRYSDQFTYAEELTQYEVLYKEGSADVIALLLSRLDHLQDILRQSFTPINQIYQCTSGIVNKSCGGVSF